LAGEQRRRGEDGDVGEDRGQCGGLGPGETQRRVVDEVQDVDAVGAQDPAEVGYELAGREVPGDAEIAEGVTHDQVLRIVG
jgi:hypothetical protein